MTSRKLRLQDFWNTLRTICRRRNRRFSIHSVRRQLGLHCIRRRLRTICGRRDKTHDALRRHATPQLGHHHRFELKRVPCPLLDSLLDWLRSPARSC